MIQNRLYIDGKDYTEWASGLDELTEEFSLKEDGSIEIGQTSTIKLRGVAYDYFKAIFLDNSCESIDREYNVRIKVSKCNANLDFVIKSQGVSIDVSSCTAKLNLNSKNDKDTQVDILRKTYFWDEEYNFIKEHVANGRIPKMLYVKELTFISKVLIYLYIVVLIPIITIIKIIAGIWDSIISFLKTLGLSDGGEKIGGKINDIQNSVENDLMGAGEFSTVYYLYDIFNFWCKQAGLKFQSSILESEPYNNMVLFGQMIKKGIEIDDCNKIHFDKNNAPNYSALELLDFLSPVFGAKWVIIDDVLYFEQEKIIDNLRVTLFNLDSEVSAGRITSSIEYTFNPNTNYARLNATYASDSVDTQGNRNIFDFYSNVIDWNAGLIHKNRKGDYSPAIKFGACRFTNDNNRNNLNCWLWDKGSELDIFSFGDLDFSHSLVLTNDTAQLLKLIIIDPNFKRKYKGCNFSFAVKNNIKPGSGQGVFQDSLGEWHYNMPMWLNNKLYPGSNLIDKFHFEKNPDLKQNKFVELQSITWRPDNFCDAAEFLRQNKLNIKITSKLGDGYIESFTIDSGKCEITLNGIKFNCNDIS